MIDVISDLGLCGPTFRFIFFQIYILSDSYSFRFLFFHISILSYSHSFRLSHFFRFIILSDSYSVRFLLFSDSVPVSDDLCVSEPATHTRVCSVACPLDCVVSEWTTWSECLPDRCRLERNKSKEGQCLLYRRFWKRRRHFVLWRLCPAASTFWPYDFWPCEFFDPVIFWSCDFLVLWFVGPVIFWSCDFRPCNCLTSGRQWTQLP